MADIGTFQDHRAIKDTPLRQEQDGNMHIKTEVTTDEHNSQKGLKNKPLKSEKNKSLIKKEVPRKRSLHSDSNIKDGRKQSHHKQPLRNNRNGMATVGGTKLINKINQPSLAVVGVSPRPSSQNIENSLRSKQKYIPQSNSEKHVNEILSQCDQHHSGGNKSPVKTCRNQKESSITEKLDLGPAKQSRKHTQLKKGVDLVLQRSQYSCQDPSGCPKSHRYPMFMNSDQRFSRNQGECLCKTRKLPHTHRCPNPDIKNFADGSIHVNRQRYPRQMQCTTRQPGMSKNFQEAILGLNHRNPEHTAGLGSRPNPGPRVNDHVTSGRHKTRVIWNSSIQMN